MDAREWKQPRRVDRQHYPKAASTRPPRHNSNGLPTPESGWGRTQPPHGVPPPTELGPQPSEITSNRTHSKSGVPVKKRHDERVRVQPHGNSYFLPSKIAGKAATFLLDSGCTTNLISRQLFDTLSAKLWGKMEPYKEEYGTLADESCIPFYGVVELTGYVRDQAIRETFIIGQLKEDAILGRPFLKRHGCRIDFSKSAIVMSGWEIACVDKFGCLLEGGGSSSVSVSRRGTGV